MNQLRSFVFSAVLGLALSAPASTNGQGFCSTGVGGSTGACDYYCVGECSCLYYFDQTYCEDSSICRIFVEDRYDGEGCNYLCGSTMLWYCMYW
jgi:hypothetical protein